MVRRVRVVARHIAIGVDEYDESSRLQRLF